MEGERQRNKESKQTGKKKAVERKSEERRGGWGSEQSSHKLPYLA